MRQRRLFFMLATIVLAASLATSPAGAKLPAHATPAISAPSTAPVAAAPITSPSIVPVASQSVVSAPVASQSVASVPVASQSVVSAPVASVPVASQSVAPMVSSEIAVTLHSMTPEEQKIYPGRQNWDKTEWYEAQMKSAKIVILPEHVDEWHNGGLEIA